MATIEDFKPYSQFFRSQRIESCYDFLNFPSSPRGNSFLRKSKLYLSSNETPIYRAIAAGQLYQFFDAILLTTLGLHHIESNVVHTFVTWGDKGTKYWLDKHDAKLLVENAETTNAEKGRAILEILMLLKIV